MCFVIRRLCRQVAVIDQWSPEGSISWVWLHTDEVGAESQAESLPEGAVAMRKYDNHLRVFEDRIV